MNCSSDFVLRSIKKNNQLSFRGPSTQTTALSSKSDKGWFYGSVPEVTQKGDADGTKQFLALPLENLTSCGVLLSNQPSDIYAP